MVNNFEKNSLREIRESRMMSKTELSRKTGISPITIRRIENGKSCRVGKLNEKSF